MNYLSLVRCVVTHTYSILKDHQNLDMPHHFDRSGYMQIKNNDMFEKEESSSLIL